MWETLNIDLSHQLREKNIYIVHFFLIFLLFWNSLYLCKRPNPSIYGKTFPYIIYIFCDFIYLYLMDILIHIDIHDFILKHIRALKMPHLIKFLLLNCKDLGLDTENLCKIWAQSHVPSNEVLETWRHRKW